MNVWRSQNQILGMSTQNQVPILGGEAHSVPASQPTPRQVSSEASPISQWGFLQGKRVKDLLP